MNKPAPAHLGLHPLIAQRWSPRAFLEDAVPAEALERLLDAAIWSASCFNDQPWRFVVADRSADPQAHATVAGCLTGWNTEWAPRAPVLLVCGHTTHFGHNDAPNRWAGHDLGLAMGNLSTQASAEGLALHAMGGFDVEKLREALGIPADIELVSVVAVGFPGPAELLEGGLRERELEPRARRSKDELVFRGRWSG